MLGVYYLSQIVLFFLDYGLKEGPNYDKNSCFVVRRVCCRLCGATVPTNASRVRPDGTSRCGAGLRTVRLSNRDCAGVCRSDVLQRTNLGRTRSQRVRCSIGAHVRSHVWASVRAGLRAESISTVPVLLSVVLRATTLTGTHWVPVFIYIRCFLLSNFGGTLDYQVHLDFYSRYTP